MTPGDVVAGRFRVESVAGGGAVGLVYRAHDTSTERLVALKLLRTVGDEEQAERFAREGGILANLRHPGIVGYVAHGLTGTGEAYIAMEWLEGVTLAARLQAERIPLRDAVTVVRRVAEGLGFAHARGVVHRDVKPSNILLVGGDPEKAKLLDFGLARYGVDVSTLTVQGQLLGTPAYMSPEQARGRADTDPRSDVFGLGSVLYHCVTGQRPFPGRDIAAVLAKILLDEPARVRDLVPDAPAEIGVLVARMMDKDPSRRPSSAAEVAGALAGMGELPATGGAPVDESHLTTAEVGVFSVVVAGGPSAPTDRLRAELARFGGRFETLREGSWLLALGGRGNAADQAAQAARAALVMRSHRPDAAVVLATGRAVLDGRLPVGEVIERAFDMVRSLDVRDLMTPAVVRVDDQTAGLLAGRFEVTRDAFGLLLRRRDDHVEPVRMLLGKPTPCVGRDRELALLESTFDECLSEPAARAVLVTAPAGVGKSRLRYELLRRIALRWPDTETWVSRGDPTSAGSPFAMIAPAVRRAAGIVDGESIDVQRAKLSARVARHTPAADLDRVASFVGELAGVPFDDRSYAPLAAARANAVLMADQKQRAWEDFVAAEVSAHPLLLVLEDMHWGDRPSARFVDALLRRLADRPFMVFALARPEIHVLFPALWHERALQEVRLSSMTRTAAEKLVRAALGQAVTTETLASIVERATGNAFYLEELIRAVAEGHGDALPDSVLSMVHARLETLEVEAKRVLRAASVFGQVFWSDGVEALIGGPEGATDVEAWLDALVDREIVTRRPDSRFPGRELTFRHALVREGAYAMLTEPDRKLGHRLAGAWLERAGERDAVVLADHFDAGEEPARAAGWYRKAAQQALEANDFEAVLSRADRASSCGVEGEPAGALALLKAEAHRWRAEWPQAEEAGRRAMSSLRSGSLRWCAAAGELTSSAFTLGHQERLAEVVDQLGTIDVDPDARGALCMALSRAASNELYAGRFERSRALATRLEQVAAEVGPNDTATLAWRDRLRAVTALYEGDLGAYLRSSASGLASYQRIGDLRGECMMRSSCGDAYKELGLFAQAEDELRRAGELADRLGIQTNAAYAKTALSYVLAQRGAFAEALALCEDARTAFDRHQDRRLAGGSSTYLAHILAGAGDLRRAEQEARAAQELLAVVPPLRAVALATLARILLSTDRAAAALDVASEAMHMLRSLGQLEEGEALVRLVYVEALLACGDQSAGRTALVEARDRLLRRASLVQDEGLRASFLTAVPDNARTLELARTVLESPAEVP